MLFSRVAVSCFAVLVTALTACSSGGRADSDHSVTLALNTDPVTFDPALSSSADSYTVARMLFDTVVRMDEDHQLVGGIADKWSSKDARHYTLSIRDDLVCADGSPITPTVVADSLRRFASPDTGSSGRTLALGNATATFDSSDADGTVEVELSEPWSDFMVGLTLPQAGIVCPAGLKDPQGLAAGKVDAASSGPYVLADAQPGVEYELALRADYEGWPEFDTPLEGEAPQTIRLALVSDSSTLATQLLAGSVDIGQITDENAKRLQDDPGFSTIETSPITMYLMFNERPGARFADDPELRKAVAQAVDAEAFSDITTGGLGSPILSVGSDDLACVNTDASLLEAHDLEAASKYLAGAEFRIVGTNLLSEGNDYVAEVLRKAGAKVEVESMDNTKWSTVTSEGGTGWDINLQGDFNFMGTLTSSLLRVMGPATEDGGRNKVGAVNEAGYRFVKEAMETTDQAEKCRALEMAQRSFLSRDDVVPLSTLPMFTVAADGLSIREFGDYVDPATIRIVR